MQERLYFSIVCSLFGLALRLRKLWIIDIVSRYKRAVLNDKNYIKWMKQSMKETQKWIHALAENFSNFFNVELFVNVKISKKG